MTVTARRPGRGRRSETRVETLACECGATVRRVSVDGGAVLLDTDRDPEGDVEAYKVGGAWRFAAVGTVSGPTFRYRTHRCRVTSAVAELNRQARSRTDTAGPCARCWSVQVPRRYGPDARTLCDPCSATVEAIRARR